MLVNYLSLVIQAAKAVINLIYVLLLLKKPVCYSPLLSLSLHQSQLTVFNTYHSCHQFIFLVSYPFGPLGGFSIQLSSHFSPCPGSPSSSQPWWQTPCQPPALGQVPGWLLLCSHAPVPLHSPCRGGLLVWHHPLLLAQAPGTHQQLFQPFCQLPRAQRKPPCSGKTLTTDPKAHNANVLHKAECDIFTSKYNLF